MGQPADSDDEEILKTVMTDFNPENGQEMYLPRPEVNLEELKNLSAPPTPAPGPKDGCLLYPSDAADE